jgi:phage shock protein C
MSGERAKAYRARDGLVWGVCKGVAEHFEVSVFWTRVAAVVLIPMTGGWILAAYVAAGFLLPPKSAVPIQTEVEQEFYDSYTHSSSMALNRLKRTYDGLNRRIQRVEDVVTTSEYDWDRRLNEHH